MNCGPGLLLVDYVIVDLTVEETNIIQGATSYTFSDNNKTGVLDSNRLLGIQVTFIDSSVNHKWAGTTPPLSLVENAYAREESSITMRMRNSLDSVSIITLSDFDSSHLKGSEIKDLFGVLSAFNQSIPLPPPTTGEVVQAIGPLERRGDDGFAPDLNSMNLVLLERSKLDSVLQFEIRMMFDDGTTVSKRTEAIVQR